MRKSQCNAIPELLRKAKPCTKNSLMEEGILKFYKKGEIIFRDREEVNFIYFVISGYIALYKMNKQQDKKVIFVYGKGELLNEVILQEPISSINCETLSDTQVLCISRKRFLRAMQEDAIFSNLVMNSMVLKIRRLYHQLGNTSNSMRLDKKIASKLWKLARDFGEEKPQGIEIGFDLSITYLADLVGSKRETVSRVIKQLVEHKLIEYQNNRFLIIDLDKLNQYCTI